MKPLILVVEDEKPIRHFIKVACETQEYECMEAKDGKEALMIAASHHPDVMILDLGLPDMDGIDVIHRIREWSQIPVIVVSARGHDREKVEALDSGADDYLTKPFSITELLARTRVSLRKAAASAALSGANIHEIKVGELEIDLEKRRVKLKGEELHLTPIEYNLLTLLAKQRGKVLTHKFIISEIWGAADGNDTQVLRASMGNLRRKIEKVPAEPRYIITEVGVGYRMAEE